MVRQKLSMAAYDRNKSMSNKQSSEKMDGYDGCLEVELYRW